jgi:predicted secreted hydrolase
MVWSQIEVSRCRYQAILDEAFETLKGDEGLAEAMVEDEKQWDWLTAIATKLEELMIMRVSPEKGGGASANIALLATVDEELTKEVLSEPSEVKPELE